MSFRTLHSYVGFDSRSKLRLLHLSLLKPTGLCVLLSSGLNTCCVTMRHSPYTGSAGTCQPESLNSLEPATFSHCTSDMPNHDLQHTLRCSDDSRSRAATWYTTSRRRPRLVDCTFSFQPSQRGCP